MSLFNLSYSPYTLCMYIIIREPTFAIIFYQRSAHKPKHAGLLQNGTFPCKNIMKKFLTILWWIKFFSMQFMQTTFSKNQNIETFLSHWFFFPEIKCRYLCVDILLMTLHIHTANSRFMMILYSLHVRLNNSSNWKQVNYTHIFATTLT